MSALNLKKYGLFATRDSGPPSGISNYTTLVLFHGFGWHSAVFSKFFPLAVDQNIRLITVNRRDYPGSVPLSSEEKKQMEDIGAIIDKTIAATALHEYIKAQSKNVYDFLIELILQEDIPVSGGIILAGWSFGISTILGLLANIETFNTNLEVGLRSYIKQAVLYDGPYHTLGYAPPPNAYNPLFDPSLAPGEGPKIFPAWVSGYYTHGDTLSNLEYRNAQLSPIPTILAMDSSEVNSCLELAPTLPGGSDDSLLMLGIKLGVFTQLKDRVLYLAEKEKKPTTADPDDDHKELSNEWDNLKLRYVWCDQSVWEMPWGTWCLQAEIEAGQKTGKAMRDVEMVCLKGANHFYHWDNPELSLKGLLSGL